MSCEQSISDVDFSKDVDRLTGLVDDAKKGIDTTRDKYIELIENVATSSWSMFLAILSGFAMAAWWVGRKVKQTVKAVEITTKSNLVLRAQSESAAPSTK